jgi:iduronate 2-sulfatase
MKRLLSVLLLGSGLWAPVSGAERPNVLLICIDDLRPELKCFGADYIHSPNIDKLAARGRAFTRHYVHAPTCGASRYALLTGRYGPRDNGALFRQAANDQLQKSTLPGWFRQHGYTTVSLGKVSHHPGGRGGPDWNDDSKPEMPGVWTRHLCPSGPWQHPRGFMHGLANGEIRKNAKEMDVLQAYDGDDNSYPDGPTIEGALEQLDLLAKGDPPFFLAVGFLRPHLPFGAPAKYVKLYDDITLPPIPHPSKPAGKTTWHGSGEFMKYNRWKKDPRNDNEFATKVRKHYAGCVSYADALVGRLIARLERTGVADKTIIVVWGDHGWHLGEHAIWGKHSLFEESLRSPLIMVVPELSHPGSAANSIVETVDLFPTLCDLTALPKPDGISGSSLVPFLADPKAPGHPAISYKGGSETIRTDRYRLIRHSKGGKVSHLELYDHESVEGETRNIAEDNADLAAALSKQLDAKLN